MSGGRYWRSAAGRSSWTETAGGRFDGSPEAREEARGPVPPFGGGDACRWRRGVEEARRDDRRVDARLAQEPRCGALTVPEEREEQVLGREPRMSELRGLLERAFE